MLKVVVLVVLAVGVSGLPESRFIGYHAQARDYPAPVYGPPQPPPPVYGPPQPPPPVYGPPQPPHQESKGQGKGKGGLFDFDIFKGIKDFFSFGGKGGGGGKGEESYGPPPAPSHGYGPPPKAPKGNYGPPPAPPKGNYGPPPKAPKGNYGPPPKSPKGNYGPPPKSPKGNYGPPPPPPKASYGPPPKAPKGNYGPPPPPPKASYGPPPQPPKGNYGPPPQPPKGNYGPPPQPPKGNYGPPPPIKGSHGHAPPPKGGFGPPKGHSHISVAPAPSHGHHSVGHAPSHGHHSVGHAPSHGHHSVGHAPSHGTPHIAPAPSHGPPHIAPAPSYAPPPVVPAPSYAPPPVNINVGYGAPKPGDILTSSSHGHAAPPPPSNHFGHPPPAPSNNYNAPPPLPLETAPAPSGNYVPPPLPLENALAPLPLENVHAPAGSYNVPLPPPPPPVAPTGYVAPTQNVIVPVAPPLPVAPAVQNIPIPSKPDCEACDHAPWVPMPVVAPVPPVPAPTPADPVVVTNPPAPIDIYPPAPAIDVRLVSTAPAVETEGPIFIVDDGAGARDPRVFDDAPLTTITSDDVIETETVFVVNEGDIGTLDPLLLEDANVRTQVDNVILDTEAPVLETEVPPVDTIAPVFLAAQDPVTFSVLDTEAPGLFLETRTQEPVETEASVLSFETEGTAPILETEAPAPVFDTEAPVPVLETEAPAPVFETEPPAPIFETEVPVAPQDLSVVDVRVNNLVQENFAEPLITPAVLQNSFELNPNDVTFRLTDPVVAEVGQPQFISSSEGTAGPSQFVSISNPEVVSVGEPQSISVSALNIVDVQQPRTQTDTGAVQIQEGFTPIIIPNVNQNIEAANVVNVGQPQFIDQSFGQPQQGIPLSVSQPQFNSVSQPQVISVSQPQILSVSQPQFQTFQQQPSQVTVTQPDGNYVAPQISTIQSSPTSSSLGGLQVAQFQNLESQITDGGFSVLSVGTPQFIGSSQGTPGVSQVVSIDNPQIVSVSDPQVLTFSGNVGVPLSATVAQGSLFSNNGLQQQSTFVQGTESHSSSQTSDGSIIAAELISSLPPNFGSFSGVEENNFISHSNQAAQPPAQIINAELISSSLQNPVSFVSSGQTVDFRQEGQSLSSQSVESSIIPAELLSYSPPNLNSFSGIREGHSLAQTESLVSNSNPSSSIIQADVIASSSHDLGSFSGGIEQILSSPQQTTFGSQVGAVSNFESSQGSVIPAELSFSNSNSASEGDNQISFVDQSIGTPVENQVISISQSQTQPASQQEFVHSISNQDSSSFNQGSFISNHDSFANNQNLFTDNQAFAGVPLNAASPQLDNNFSIQQDISSGNNQFISGPTFVGESFGDIGSSQVVSLSEPQVSFVSQPELLHYTFSSADLQDSLGISITSTSAQVKTPDMSSLPLADSSSFSLSSSSPEFPPFSIVQDIANEPINTVDVPAQPAIVVQDTFAPSFQQTIRETPPQLSYLPPINSAPLGNVVDVRASSQQEAGNTRVAKSVFPSQNANTINSQPSVISPKDINGINLRPIPVRKTPSFELSDGQAFEPLSRDSSGFEYSTPGQRVQISFGFPSHTQFDGKSSDGSSRDNNENPRPARNIGTVNLNGAPGNTLFNRNRNKSSSKDSHLNNNLLPKIKSSTTTTQLPPTTTEVSSPHNTVVVTTTTTTTPTPTTTRTTTTTTTAATTTTTIIATTEKQTPRIRTFPTKTEPTTENPSTTTETSELTTIPETDTSTVKTTTIKPRFRGRKRLRRPLSRRPITSSTQSPADEVSPLGRQQNTSLFSVRRRIAPRQRHNGPVVLASELRKEDGTHKKLINDTERGINDQNNQDLENGNTEESSNKVIDQEETSSEDPLAGTTDESQNAVVGNIDVRGSAKSIASGQSSFALPQRNSFVFPQRRDPILPFGTRLSRPRPSSPFTNPTAGPSPLTSSKTLPVMQASKTLTNSLDKTRPFQIFQSEKSLTPSKPELPNNIPTDKPGPNQSPAAFQLDMLPVMAPLNLPFIVASVISPANNDTTDPPPEPSEILAPPPSPHLITKSTHPPRLQRLFPSQQIPGTFTLHQNQESFVSSSFSSSSSSSMSHEESHHMNSSHFSRSNTEPLLGQSQDSSSSSNSIIGEQEEESSSSSSQSTLKKPDTTANPLPATRKVISRAKLFPTSVKPTTVLNSVSQGVGKALLPHQMPVLQRPLTPKTRPLTRVAQRPVSEDYIKNFPEAAAPEGFPGEDPEEETIKNNIIELQRIN